MTGRTLSEGKDPKTQSTEAVKQLIEFVTGKPCEELPATFALANGAQLILSSKKDCYYYTTLQTCSCKAGENHKLCWHRRDLCEAARIKLKAEKAQSACEASREQARAYQARQIELRAKASSVPAIDSIRPTEKWAGGMNGPVDPAELKVVV